MKQNTTFVGCRLGPVFNDESAVFDRLTVDMTGNDICRLVEFSDLFRELPGIGFRYFVQITYPLHPAPESTSDITRNNREGQGKRKTNHFFSTEKKCEFLIAMTTVDI